MNEDFCETIYCLQEVCHCYWSQRKGDYKSYDNITVTLTAQEIFSDYNIRKLQISKLDSEKSDSNSGHTITQFQYLTWPEDNVPQVTSSILEIASLVQKVQISTGNKAIVVMCKYVKVLWLHNIAVIFYHLNIYSSPQ